MGLWPLIGAVFMAYLFVQSIPQLNAPTLWVGLGAMALGLIPMFYYWAKKNPYYEMPAKARRGPRGVREESLERARGLVEDVVVRIVSPRSVGHRDADGLGPCAGRLH